MSDEGQPLQALADAVQTFIAATEDEAWIVTGSVVVAELVRFSDAGEQLHNIVYAIPGEVASMSGSIGLLRAGERIVLRDATDDDDDSDLP